MSKKDYFCIGKIVGTRGLKGELKVETYTDFPEDFYEIKNIFLDVNSEPLNIKNIRVHKSQVLILSDGVENCTQAEAFRGKFLYAFKKDIPLQEDRFFIEELKGCTVSDAKTNKVYGTVKDIFNTGANDIYTIANENGEEYLLPIIEGTIEKINLEDNKITVNPIKGVFDED